MSFLVPEVAFGVGVEDDPCRGNEVCDVEQLVGAGCVLERYGGCVWGLSGGRQSVPLDDGAGHDADLEF